MSQKQLGALDVFKMIAALLVVAVHTSPLTSINEGADFIFTRGIARVGVPFFAMVSGYFFFTKIKDKQKVTSFIARLIALYIVSMIIYVPLGMYAGVYEGTNIVRLLLFDGVFYHLWYFPAMVLCILIVHGLCKVCSIEKVLGISAILYMIGLFGDSYYGVIQNIPLLSQIYDFNFIIFEYTRNGLYFLPFFFTLGMYLYAHTKVAKKTALTLSVVSLVGMCVEAQVLHTLEWQRHDSMYICLIPTMYFFFSYLLSIRMSPLKNIREMTTWVYILHPLCIVLIRGASQAIGLESIFVYNSVIHYICVCIASLTMAFVIGYIPYRIKQKKVQI